MNQTCETVQDLLPELAAGRLEGEAARAARTHAEGCGECASVLETLELLAQAPMEVPAGLEERIQGAVTEAFNAGAGENPGLVSIDTGATRRGRRRSRFMAVPAWGLAAAAVLAIVAGRGVFLGEAGAGGDGAVETDFPSTESELVALGEYTGPTVVAETDMVAGAPLLDGLSDEDLMMLLEEWEG